MLSFSNDEFIAFPPETWGVRQFRQLFSSEIWTLPLVRSVVIAAVVAAVATVLGAMAALALARGTMRGKAMFQALVLLPLLVPGVVYAISAYQVFADLDIVGTRLGFVLAHTVLAVPFVMLVMTAAIARVPRELELAAMSLGAGRARAVLDITLRLLAPAMVAGALYAFSLSLNEVVVSNFLAGLDFTTLPVAIFASLRISVEPVVMAIATVLAAASIVVVGAGFALRRRTG